MLPEILIQTSRDQDYYVVWSWESDRPIRGGTRGQLEGPRLGPGEFSQAQELGSTDGGRGHGPVLPWDDLDGMPTGELGATICRQDLKAAVERLELDPDDDLLDLMTWPSGDD